MSTSPRKKAKTQTKNRRLKIERGFVPATALAKSLKFGADMMHVHFTDGRILSVPVLWFPRLREATPKQRTRYEIGGGGVSLHWPELDEDLSVAGLMAGVDWRSA
jgi:hypothetical protein